MMKFRSTKVAGVALAVAGITALAACSSSGSSSSGGSNATTVKVAGGIGEIPVAPAGEKVKAGTITWAMQPSAVPNWIFPVIPSANNSVYNAFTFIWEMWRPLYWQTNGVVPEIEQNMSIASLPKYTNGTKTVTISLKSNYKWSDGKPITANDLLFAIDLIKAAIKVVSSELGRLHARLLPGQPGEYLGAELDDPGDEPQVAGQPVLVHRGHPHQREPDAEHRVGQDVGERLGRAALGLERRPRWRASSST